METLGIDQYGTTYRNLGEHPRKALAQRLGFSPKSARKVYQDKKDGRTVHVGYAIGHYWILLYKLEPIEKP